MSSSPQPASPQQATTKDPVAGQQEQLLPAIKSSLNKIQDQELKVLLENYLNYEKIEQHKQHVEKLILENELEQLERLVGRRLAFGTAGIRGSMGPGFGQMNDLVIIQTSQGLASYLLESFGEATVKSSGIIVGHDARHNSSRFARLTALAFLQKGIPVYFCERIIPTPIIAHGVKHFGCCAGVVITASHNPKNDNGYKVYWSNGAQILSPHDKLIQEHILKPANQKPWPLAWQHELLENSSLSWPSSSSLSQSQLSPSSQAPQNQQQTTTPQSKLPNGWDEILFRIYGDLSKSYFSYIETLVGDRRPRNQSSDICITYTTMHGVGHMFLARALDIAGFEDVFPVELQKKPDPDFSTVKFPNPEESGALDLAFETAKHANSNLILANDPDADRCAAALYNPNSHYKRILTGNEIGALLGWWQWHCYLVESVQDFDNLTLTSTSTSETTTAAAATDEDQMQRGSQEENDSKNKRDGLTNIAIDENNEERASQTKQQQQKQQKKKKPSDCYMISTAVSSKFLQSMAQIEGFQFIETLTGFKYMGNLADELINKHNKCVLFAFEEAIGYMVDATILDKDGISAAVQLAQCAAYVNLTYKRTLEQHLNWLYTMYGYHYSLNSYFLCYDQATIREIFQNLQSNYPKSICGGKCGCRFTISRIRDLNNGYDSGELNSKATLPCNSSSYMVTLFADDPIGKITFTIRTSGTEPKIKYYSEIVTKLPPLESPVETYESNNFNDSTQLAAKKAAQDKLREFVHLAVEQCLKPAQYNLEPAD